MKSKKKLIISAACLFFIFLLGCSEMYVEDTTSLTFKKDGSIVLHIVDDLDESKYSYEELKALNEAEVNVYNSYGKGKVSIEKSAFENGIVTIDLLYSNDDAYYDMNHRVLFYGTVYNARNAGYNFTGKVSSTEDNSSLEAKQWNAMNEQRVVVVSEPIDVIMPGKIIYIGSGITLNGKSSASVEGEGLHYIVCE